MIQNNTSNQVHTGGTIPSSFLLASICILLVGITKLLKGSAFGNTSLRSKVSRCVPTVSNVPFVGAGFAILWNRKSFLKLMESYFHRHGSIFRFRAGLNDFVVISNADVAQKLLTSSKAEYLEKSKFFFEAVFGGTAIMDGIAASGFEKWKPHRQFLAKAYNYQQLRYSANIINKYAERVMTNLKLGIGTLPQLVHSHTLEAITHLTMGMDISMESSDVKQLLKLVDKGREFASIRLRNPLLWYRFFWRLHPKYNEFKRVYSSGEKSFKQYISDAKHSISNNKNIMGTNEENRFVSPMEMMIMGNMEENDILAEAMSLILAGHETTSISIILLMFNLSIHKNHQVECRKEIDSLFERMKAEKRSQISMEDTSELKYLERCIKESMRLLPPVPFYSRELFASLTIEDGVELGKGTYTFVSSWLLHRNPEYYPNPEQFNPDRFLPDNCTARHPYAYMPFNIGPRNCIAWKLGMMEVTIFSAWILRHFELYTKDKFEDVNFQFDVTLGTEKEIDFTLKKRLNLN